MTSKTEGAWRVGVLFSESGTTHVTETEHLRGTELAIAEINAAGGIRGKPIEPVIHDPGARNDSYLKYARQLLAEDEVDVIFGCSMSASRKTVLPIVERYNGLLFYPSMYEGFEYCENLVYSGATVNQTCLPLADYLVNTHGGRISLVGSDYIFPRESNRIMRDLIEARGGEIVGEAYVPLGAGVEDLDPILRDILAQKPDAVFSTMIGTSAQAFYRLYDEAGIDRAAHPIASLTMAETEMAKIGRDRVEGHVLASTYFQTLETEVNRRFVAAFKARFGAEATTSIWSESAYLQVQLFARALDRLGVMDPRRLSQAPLGDEFEAPEGLVRVDPETRHLWLTPRIGVARADGLFDVVWEGNAPVRPDPYLATTRIEETALELWS
ncbi:transporter substrate-binding domain-containing protein [Marinibacterium profundimaris]|uniref:Amino acid ABC transporter substrate-binding protein n=1 Tax=Marinibacterium profundimaris TaxID=1679460 RepID=A0A225NLM4_9RHOB|nr:transporter substrate-binding domain-containing protein [Marinibacterium profundimaris]OWU74946.1 amino acid ABC transporter substrate-binding protein [Marinibacterium profundimaris]